MKKFLLAFGVTALSLSAYAANEYTSTPAEGAINAVEYPGGIGSIEINVSNAVINRNCTGLATLSKGGEILKAIPASNIRMVYTFQEFDKTEVGTPHITFYNENNSPASMGGNYVVTIPSNFFTVNGKPNARLEYSFKVSGDGVVPVYFPEKGASIPEFSKFSITFENASRVQYTGGNTGIYLDVTNPELPDSTINVYPKNVEVVDNVLTATFDPYTVEGQIFLNVKVGVVKYQEVGVAGTKTLGEQMIRYYIAPAMDNGFTLTPAPGTITSLKPYKEGTYTSYGTTIPEYYYFDLKLPEGYTCGYTNVRKAGLFMEDENGKLKSTPAQYFTTWVGRPDEQPKDGWSMVLRGEDNNEIKLAPGKYYLVIPKSSFYVKSPDAVAASPYTEELKFGPWIVEGEPAAYTVTPSEEPTDALSEIKITFEEGANVVVNKIGWFTIMEGPVEYDVRGTAEGNVVTLKISPALTTPGDYTLYSEASNIKVNGVDTEVTAKFTVVKSFITELNLLSDNKPVEGKIVDDPDYGQVWVATVETPADATTTDVLFELPYGYNELYVLDYSVSTNALRIPVEDLLANHYELVADNTLKDLAIGTHFLGFSYGSNGDALVPSFLQLTVVQGEPEDPDPVGVEEVVIAEDAEYYTLQGLKVTNPEKGIYIKVVDGKAVKVNVK